MARAAGGEGAADRTKLSFLGKHCTLRDDPALLSPRKQALTSA